MGFLSVGQRRFFSLSFISSATVYVAWSLWLITFIPISSRLIWEGGEGRDWRRLHWKLETGNNCSKNISRSHYCSRAIIRGRRRDVVVVVCFPPHGWLVGWLDTGWTNDWVWASGTPSNQINERLLSFDTSFIGFNKRLKVASSR